MSESSSKRKHPDGGQETKWVTVAETPGLAPAEIIASRLQSEGIPARAWQEGAGQALGLTIGLLGTGHVVVPEEYEEQANEILAESDALEFDEDYEDEEDLDSDFNQDQ